MAKTYHYKNGDGNVDTAHPFTFPYIKEADVKVKVFNTSTDVWDPLTQGVAGAAETEYYIHNATFIKFDTDHVPASGTNNIYIYRETDKDKLAATFYPGSAIRSTDLNENYTQNLYASEESAEKADDALDNSRELQSDGSYKAAITIADDAYDNSVKQTGVTPPGGDNSAITIAEDAKDVADAAKTVADTANDNSVKQTGVTPPGGANAAITIAEAAKTEAEAATDNSLKQSGVTPPGGANAAITIAESAADDAADAVSTANTARDNSVKQTGVTPPGGANAAITIAEDAYDNAVNQTGVTPSGGANAAITIAEAADETATTAKNAVDTYVHDGTSVKGDGIDPNPKGVAYAINIAEQARDDVADAVLYDSVANKTALEALQPTEDGDYQISDSSGLTDGDTWTNSAGTFTITGIDPTTDNYPTTQLDGITTRLKYTHTSPAKTFTFVSYFANDSDDRYMVGPASDGNANEVLTTNGSGVLTWEVGGNVTIDGGTFTLGTSLVNSTVTYDGGSFN